MHCHGNCNKVLYPFSFPKNDTQLTRTVRGGEKRSLFSLHQHILDTLSTTTSNNTPPIIWQMQETSLNALHTATRIMIDVSHDHVEYGVPHASETFPLCGGYNLRCAVAHLKRYGAKDTRYSSRRWDIDGDLARLEELYVAF